MLLQISHLDALLTCIHFLFICTPIAALAAFYTIHETQPDLIINAGTAGGFKRIGAEIGDAFISTICAHHDRRIVIPDFVPYGKGTHPSVPTKNLVQVNMFGPLYNSKYFIIAHSIALCLFRTDTHQQLMFVCLQMLNFKSGVVTAGNSLDHTEMVIHCLLYIPSRLLFFHAHDTTVCVVAQSKYITQCYTFIKSLNSYIPLLIQDDILMLENDASVKDMEAAAIAYVAELANVPFFALKVVTDIVDGDRPTTEEFLENLGTAAKSLQEKIPKVIDFVAGRKISEL